MGHMPRGSEKKTLDIFVYTFVARFLRALIVKCVALMYGQCNNGRRKPHVILYSCFHPLGERACVCLCVYVITNEPRQQYDILTSVDSDEPLQPSFKLRNSKWCSVSSLTIIEYSSD